jgi:ABC-type transporter Mla subunit MlaD
VKELFQVSPEEFVKARDALARKLEDEGRADEAKRVASLRKPSQALWLVNQMARRAPAALQALIEATEKLRAGADLREGMSAQREALHKLLDAAGPLPQAAQRRVQNTLQAAAMAEPDALREGRLEHELGPSGFEALIAGGVVPRSPPPAKAAEEKKRERELRAAEQAADELAARAEKLERAAAQAEAAAAKARDTAREARARADQAAARALELRRRS